MEKVTKKVSRFWHWGHKTNKAPCPSSDLTANISSSDTTTILQYRLGKLWDNFKTELQKLQNRAARVLTCSNYDVDGGHVFKLLGWKNLAREQQIQRATMVCKSLHGLAPNYLSSKFERRETAHNLKDSMTL